MSKQQTNILALQKAADFSSGRHFRVSKIVKMVLNIQNSRRQLSSSFNGIIQIKAGIFLKQMKLW